MSKDSDRFRLVHVAPEFPPVIGGVADYALILTRRLVEASGGRVDPVLVRAGWKGGPEPEVEFPCVDLAGKCSASALAETLSRRAGGSGGQSLVLLEYSGYGYAKRGAPVWLSRGLDRVCGEEGVPLITMFHEVYASGPPWKSAFWMTVGQRYVASQIASKSHEVVSNRADAVTWLRARTDAPVHYCPVFSNVGEPEAPGRRVEREPYAVIFGGTGKDALYEKHGARLEAFLCQTGIKKIIDIGPQPPDQSLSKMKRTQVDILGFAKAPAISEYLQKASMGFLCRNPRALTKSGCFAAYMAHGVPAVIAQRHKSSPAKGLKEGLHYLPLRRVLEEGHAWHPADWEEMGQRMHKWYQRHAHSSRTAERFLELME